MRASSWLLQLLTVLGLLSVSSCISSEETSPVQVCDLGLLARTPVEDRLFEHEGVQYKLSAGKVYVWNSSTSTWDFLEEIYDPDYFKKHYVVTPDCKVFRVDPDSGQRTEARKSFSDNFEGISHVRELIGLPRLWQTITLQSPLAPSVPEYVALFQCIVSGTCDFKDYRIDIDSTTVKSGLKSLKTFSVPRSLTMVTAKSSLTTSVLFFEQGDDIWTSSWHYLAQGYPLSILDIESTWEKTSPGPRLMINETDHSLYVELKWLTKPKYQQPLATKIAFPSGKWVHVKAHLRLSAENDGVIQVWQDGVKIIDTVGQTLPLKNLIITNLEIGVTSYSQTSGNVIMYTDDVRVSGSDFQ